ncbi:MAG: coenzyme F420-0:L-glutamate ligase [Acidimicrobiia bacterium]
MIEIHPIEGIKKIVKGDDLGLLIGKKLNTFTPITDQDVLVVASKVISKSRGRITKLDSKTTKQSIVEQESKRIIRQKDNLIISETKHGFICANAGVDESDTDEGYAILLPNDIDSAAYALHHSINAAFNISIPVIISNAFTRPFRKGKTSVALGLYGIKTFSSSSVAIADELASTAELVMQKSSGICAALVRGIPTSYLGNGKASDYIRNPNEELFR